ncbi:MAG: hypothetical protein MJA28_08390 [Gammaproteobacteria bacterium]|nr:hypothetical protein [Gammaproteobacteria bacterium]
MKRFSPFLLTTLGLSAVTINPVMAAPEQGIVLNYEVFSDKQKIGDIHKEHAFVMNSEDRYEQVTISTQVRASGWWGSWSLDTESRYVFSGLDVLRFGHKITEDGKKFHVVGEKLEDRLWASASEVKTQQLIDDDAFFNLALAITNKAPSPGGEALIGEGLLGDGAKAQKEIRIPMKSFVSTVEKLPSLARTHGYRLSGIKVEFLDSGELEIVSYVLNSVEQETLSIDGHEYDCYVIEAKTPEGEAKYWIAEVQGEVFLVRETGHDSDGPYEIVLRELKTKPGNGGYGKTDRRLSYRRVIGLIR